MCNLDSNNENNELVTDCGGIKPVDLIPETDSKE